MNYTLPWGLSPLTGLPLQVPLTATLDTGASISAVHPCTLLKCGVNEDIVLPWTFSPLELSDSKQCTPLGHGVVASEVAGPLVHALFFRNSGPVLPCHFGHRFHD